MKLDVVVVVGPRGPEGVDIIKILGGPSTLFWIPKAPAITFLHTHTNREFKKIVCSKHGQSFLTVTSSRRHCVNQTALTLYRVLGATRGCRGASGKMWADCS